MARRLASAEFGDPSQWPDWVLRFPGGLLHEDSERRQRESERFRDWRRRRNAWLAEHAPGKGPRAVYEELRRRVRDGA